jgi:VWFA-related protein
VLLLIALVGDADPQVPPAGDGQVPEFSVNVDLVELHATVRDRKGAFVSDLLEEHFEVYEDGVLQSIRLFRNEDVPVTVGLVVDHSGSMRGKVADVLAAARTFVQSSNPEDEMFVVNFNERVVLGLPDGIQFSNDPDELERAILRAPVTGQTALYDAAAKALEVLQAGGRDKKALVVISDGGDTASAGSLAEVLKLAGQSNALVYTVGVFDEEQEDRNPDVLRRLARATGGEAFFPGQLSEVVAVCERIARDIRNQYTLGYVSLQAAQPGAYRKIRVAVKAAGYGRLSARAREGYIAGGESRPVKDENAQ